MKGTTFKKILEELYKNHRWFRRCYYFCLFLIGKIKKVPISDFEIVWHHFDVQQAYPKIYEKIKREGYRPFSNRDGFISGFYIDKKFLVTTGRHRAKCLQELSYKKAYCLFLSEAEGKKRAEQLVPEYSELGILYRVVMRLKFAGISFDWEDKILYDIIKQGCEEYKKHV